MSARTPHHPAHGRFADALDAALHRKGMPLTHLSRRLGERGAPVSVATLSMWRSGQRRPERCRSFDVVANLEDLLDLPSGALTNRLGPSRRVGPDREQAFGALIGASSQARALDGELGFGGPSTMEPIAEVKTIEFDQEGPGFTLIHQIHWRARAERARYVPLRMKVDNPGEIPPALSVDHGGTVRDSRWHDGSGYAVWQLSLDRTLDIGEMAMTQHRIYATESTPATNFWLIAQRRLSFCALSVRWGAQRPREVFFRQHTDAGDEEWLLPEQHDTAYRALTRFGPGTFGFDWDW